MVVSPAGPWWRLLSLTKGHSARSDGRRRPEDRRCHRSTGVDRERDDECVGAILISDANMGVCESVRASMSIYGNRWRATSCRAHADLTCIGTFCTAVLGTRTAALRHVLLPCPDAGVPVGRDGSPSGQLVAYAPADWGCKERVAQVSVSSVRNIETLLALIDEGGTTIVQSEGP